MMARDPGLAGAVDTHLAEGCGPATALAAAAEDYCARFVAAGGYLAERVTDLRDVCDRAIARLLGQEEPGCPPSRGRASSWPTTSRRPRRPGWTPPSSSPSSPRPAERSATPPSSPPSSASRPSCRWRPRRGSPTARRWPWTATPGWWWSTPTRPTGPSWSSAPSSGPGCWRPATAPGAPATACRWPMVNIGTVQDAVTAARPGCRGRRPVPYRAALPRRGPTRPLAWSGRPRPTPGCSRPSPASASSSAPWTPARTSHWSFADRARGKPGPGAAWAAPLAWRPDLLDTQLAALARAARATGGGRPRLVVDGRHRRGGRLVRPPGPRERPPRRSG